MNSWQFVRAVKMFRNATEYVLGIVAFKERMNSSRALIFASEPVWRSALKRGFSRTLDEGVLLAGIMGFVGGLWPRVLMGGRPQCRFEVCYPIRVSCIATASFTREIRLSSASAAYAQVLHARAAAAGLSAF